MLTEVNGLILMNEQMCKISLPDLEVGNKRKSENFKSNKHSCGDKIRFTNLKWSFNVNEEYPTTF